MKDLKDIRCMCCDAAFDDSWSPFDEDGNYICPYCGSMNDFSDPDIFAVLHEREESQKQQKEDEIEKEYLLGDELYDKEEYEEAFAHIKFAADNGHIKAQNLLGLCYDYGRGVPQDIVEAARLYKLAAAQGDEDAKNALKRLKGYGIS